MYFLVIYFPMERIEVNHFVFKLILLMTA